MKSNWITKRSLTQKRKSIAQGIIAIAELLIFPVD